jgi:hypothetical protein
MLQYKLLELGLDKEMLSLQKAQQNLINLKQQYHETDEAETTVDSQTNLTE